MALRSTLNESKIITMVKLITTSWDDGHPLDLRIADLLDKYHLKGTFYIPKSNPQNPVMKESDLVSLSRRFEIGGHTLNHINLRKCSSKQLNYEIKGCYDWLKNLTGVSPASFCPPFGKYTEEALHVIYHSGFRNVRTTNLLCPHFKRPVMDTTMQVFNHSSLVYFKHLLIRSKLSNLRLWSRSGLTSNYLKLAEFYLNYIDTSGGYFHLWGHSWEIEKFGLWNQLEGLFKLMANRAGFDYLENGSTPVLNRTPY